MDHKQKSLVLRKPKDPVLIIEDTVDAQELLKAICDELGIKYVVAENGKVALKKCLEQKFSIYITDLMMPEMDGATFIRKIKAKYPDAVIIVQTGLDSAESIIDIMKMGVYDYVIKPIDPDVFQATIIKALEYKYLKDSEKIQSMNASKKIKWQIDWLNYKEKRHITTKDFADAKSIYNLKTSLSQGAGFGSLITLIDLIQSDLQETDGKYCIEKSVIDMLVQNNEYCRTQVNGITFVANLIEQEFELKETDAATFVHELKDNLKDVIKALSKRDMLISFPELRRNCKLHYNKKMIAMLQEEIVVNALKYGSPGTKINLFTHIEEGYFWFSVMNTVPTKPYGGIDKENEVLVLEPFYRIHPPVEEFNDIEKIGFGLGLTVVDYVVKMHKGLFFIKNVSDISTDMKQLCVLADMLLPIVGDE